MDVNFELNGTVPDGLTIHCLSWISAERLASESRLFVILDACDTPVVPEKADELGPELARSLYIGAADEEHWAIAPYLFAVDPSVLQWIGGFASEPWGIFVVLDNCPSVERMEVLFKHFRRFLIVQGGSELMYCRFYDPRVLPHYLQTAPIDELRTFFGPCRTLGAINNRPDAKKTEQLLWFSLRSAM